MNMKEAEKIIRILLTADGGCEYCASNLLSLFCKEFPEFKELAENIFKATFGKRLNNFTTDTFHQKERYRLHGWDDEKIYFWDEGEKKEWCVSDEKVLYDKLLEICIKYFKGENEKIEKEAK